MCEALRDFFKDELQEQYEAGMSQRDITFIQNMQKNNFTINQMILATGNTENEIKKILESA